jgi:NAD-dependent DNA ligase
LNEVSERNLKLISYGIGYCSDNIINSQIEALEFLKTFGFTSQNKYSVAENIEEALEYLEELDCVRHSFLYWMEGAIFKINAL